MSAVHWWDKTIPCSDCTQEDGRHDVTCPTLLSLRDQLDNDITWFLAHPHKTLRPRRMSYGERHMSADMVQHVPDTAWEVIGSKHPYDLVSMTYARKDDAGYLVWMSPNGEEWRPPMTNPLPVVDPDIGRSFEGGSE